MVGIKLRSGKLSEYVAMGAEGAPAYTSADQLRVAIRRHMGQESADFFAVAKPNDSGDGIEWYAPNRGTVIPWSSATPEEKDKAKAMLVEAQEKILEHSATLLKNENQEQQLFGKLLEKSVRIPDDTHVYIVNGKPVVTFWGFDKPNAPAGADTITTLITVPNTPEEIIEEEIVPPQKKSSFLMWLIPLLLLLLLLLLLWFLYFYPKEPEAIAVTPSVTERPVIDDNDQEEDTVLDDIIDDENLIENDLIRKNIHRDRRDTSYTGNHDRSTTNLHNNTLDRTTDTINSDLVNEGRTDEDLVLDEDALLENGEDTLPEEVLMDDEGTLVDGDILEEDIPLPEVIGNPEGNALTDEAIGNPEEQVPSPQDGVLPESSPENNTMNENTPSEDMSEEALRREGGRNQRKSRAQPLTIPPEALKSGSTEFMDGEWASHAGLIDSKTGKPIKVEYDIEDGAGQARIKRPDGSVCSGNVGTSIENGQLVINGQDSIRCPDGVTYDTSKVVCSNNENGSGTDCKGINEGGKDYPVRLRKSE